MDSVETFKVDGKDIYKLILELRPTLDNKPVEIVQLAALTIAVSAVNPNLNAERMVDAVQAAALFIANYTSEADGTVN